MQIVKDVMLCKGKEKSENENEDEECKSVAPDGGLTAWLVCLATVWAFGVHLGFEFNYGLIYDKIINVYNTTENRVIYAGSIGSVALGLECLFFLPSAVLIDLFGARKIAVLGGVLSTIGLLSSAFVFNLQFYYLTYSILFSFGESLLTEATYSILPHYFDKKLGLANGLMNFGGSIITIIMLVISAEVLDSLELKYTFIVLSLQTLICIITSGLIYKPLIQTESDKKETFCAKLKESFGIQVLKKPQFIIWFVSACFGTCGLTIAIVSIDHHAKNLFPGASVHLLNILYTSASGIGSIIFGKILDYCTFSHIYFHTFSYFLFCTAQIGLIFAPSFGVLTFFYSLVGLGDGIYFACLVSIACQVTGSSSLSNQAIGYYHTFITVSTIIGPIISDIMFNANGNYTYAYCLSSSLCFIGASIQLFYPGGFLWTKIKQMTGRHRNDSDISMSILVSKTMWDEESIN